MAQPADIEEVSGPDDRYADFNLWDYTPAAPTFGKLRQATLLWHSLAACDAPPRLREIFTIVRAALGPFRTIWGVKQANGVIAWEVYFLDYGRLQRDVSIERILALLAPLAPCALHYDPRRPYFQFSIDVDTALGRGERGIDTLNIYIGNPHAGPSSGLSYTLSKDGLRFDNLYQFYDRATQWDDIVGKVASSAHLSLPGLRLEEILIPELCDCWIITVANKKFNDGVYFSRIGIDQLLFFLKRFSFPSAIHAFVLERRHRLDHLRFDVGIDYRMVDGRIEVLKAGYYGII